MSSAHGSDEEVGFNMKDPKLESEKSLFSNGLQLEEPRVEGDLVKELEIYISNVRQSYSNDEKFKQAQDALFSFNVGLLCGLKQGGK